jgi:thiamine-phosphate pyrophosphorylase
MATRSPRIRGLYAVTPEEPSTRVLEAQVAAALTGGATIVQYRSKSTAPALRLEQARALAALCQRHRVPLIINDDIALALAVDAAGAHLGLEDGDLAAARTALGPNRLLGASCYNELAHALNAQQAGADYVAFGSFFPSTVKPGAVPAALDILTSAKRVLHVPVVAIGGITVANAPQLIAAGADALAVISALFAAPDITTAARQFAALYSPRP